jgi:hypothetical protein
MNAPVFIRRHHAPQMQETSVGIGPDIYAGKPFDMDRFRIVFPNVWADFLRRHFRDKEHVAFFFDVDERCARNWLSGLNSPTGPRAVAAVLQFPDLRARLMEAVAA